MPYLCIASFLADTTDSSGSLGAGNEDDDSTSTAPTVLARVAFAFLGDGRSGRFTLGAVLPHTNLLRLDIICNILAPVVNACLRAPVALRTSTQPLVGSTRLRSVPYDNPSRIHLSQPARCPSIYPLLVRCELLCGSLPHKRGPCAVTGALSGRAEQP